MLTILRGWPLAHARVLGLFILSAWPWSSGPALAQGTCVDVNNCTGARYTVQKDFTLSNPGTAPTNAAGPTTGGACTSAETYTTYLAWCNESGCTAVSPASSNFQPSSGSTNFIAVSRLAGAPPAGATSWAVYFSKASDPTTIRNCNSTIAAVATAAATATTENCGCLANGGQQQAANSTGLFQTNHLDPGGSIKVSAKDGTVQSKLTVERNVLDYTTDVIPRFSPDGGTNYRSVDWNSATVYYVDATVGGGPSAAGRRTVFSSLGVALAAITDSSYTKPYIVKLRSNDGSKLGETFVGTPYVWIQGDGATRISGVKIRADGVRISGVITTQISITTGTDGVPADVDNVWITNNVITSSGPETYCGVNVKVGGGGRSHSIHVSNNRLGGQQDPGSTFGNDCALQSWASYSAGPTEVHFIDNYVESWNCLHGFNPLQANGNPDGGATEHRVFSSRNTFVCNVAAGFSDPGENFACVMLESGFGHLTSIDDVCMIYRPDVSPASSYYYVFAETDRPYTETHQRSADFINPTLLVNLPAARLNDDHIAYLLMDTPYLTFTITNPRYRELALGSGWSPGDRNFALIGGARTPPPSGSNTFLKWANVVESPGPDIYYYLGATSASATSGPLANLLPVSMGKSMLMNGANLPTSCTQNELRYDTGGSTKEICLCNSSGGWNCFPLGAHID